MAFSQLEEEVLDVLRERGAMTGLALREALQWSTTRLHPLLAQLEGKRAIRKWTQSEYPRDTYYTVVK